MYDKNTIFDLYKNQEIDKKWAVQILTHANEATITTPGWLNKNLANSNSIDAINYIAIRYNVTTANPMGNLDFYIPTIDRQGIITLRKAMAPIEDNKEGNENV